MKASVRTLVLFMAIMPLLVCAQQPQKVNVLFYEKLAERDALNELNLNLVDAEDEADFWKDQERFEAELQKKEPNAFAIYLAKKKIVYLAHKKTCSEKCKHSALFAKHASKYFLDDKEIIAAQ
ncbi:hypothetical protein [Croceivirga radicis]|uniref:Uncharacterized protein n=1 Tax=Croceivirga radicis TaxID=1929488 RepID=A0A1V6LVF5_9FLAO|nr:hypothetical protein [Croceivirga radicis]OQD43986.1 hypothetical protein BUL40_00065 [Croceivirga radicis]